MANEEQLAILKQGVKVWNLWRNSHPSELIDLTEANFNSKDLHDVDFTNADLSGSALDSCNLRGATLDGAILRDTWMASADLRGAKLREAYFNPVQLQGADMRNVIFDNETIFYHAKLDHQTVLIDIRWNGADLTAVNWDGVTQLGEESKKFAPEISMRSYRQVAVQLHNQGMHEQADLFAYRARICHRQFMRRKRRYGSWLWSYFLDGLAGYGYYPGRVFLIYICVLVSFATAYYFTAQASHVALSVWGAIILSITSFHGRGFFPLTVNLDSPVVAIAAGEAILGLFIEASFIATFTQRYFGDR